MCDASNRLEELARAYGITIGDATVKNVATLSPKKDPYGWRTLVWRSQDGREYMIKELATPHLRNILKRDEHRPFHPTRRYIISRIRDELNIRELKEP